MGLFVNLYVNHHSIPDESWEKTYQESLLLLEKFPIPLMRLQREEIRGQKRNVFTTHLIKEENTSDEHWEIDGDLLSYQQAESFRLRRHFFKKNSEYDHKHILWAEEDGLEYTNGNGINLFGNKTQGYPYHLAILSVGILFENRFPHNIFVIGDIDRTQAESVIAWMNTILTTPVIMPICLDGPRLYAQLNALYDESALAIRRFKTLSRDSEEEQLQTLLRYADKSLVLQNIVEILRGYSELSQFGVIDEISQFLSVTQDIQQLIEIVLTVGQDKPSFNLEELLRLLGNKFVTIDKEERQPLFIFMHSSESLMTIKDAFAQVFLKLGGAPSFIDFYMERSELLDLFSTYQPGNQQKFKEILAASEKKCRDELEQIKTLLSEMENSEKSKPQQSQIEFSEEVIPQQKSYSPEEKYIIEQAYLQQEEYEQAEVFAKQIGQQLQQIIETYPDIFSANERTYYLEMIYKASSKNGFALCESAWQQIDQAEDIKILKSLLALSLVSEREIHFWNWRRYIMEHSYLWSYLIAEITD